MLKVLIVDDSPFMRVRINLFLDSEPGIKVVGIARDGYEAIEKTKHLKPDVITMDYEMPEMSGLEAVEHIMSECPTPIIMVSSFTYDGAETTIKALRKGAVDYLHKEELTKEDLISKIYLAKDAKLEPLPLTDENLADMDNRRFSVVGIGISTGGPRALSSLLPKISPKISASIVIAQHMPASFTASLAERLNKDSAITVKEAEHGELLRPAYAYICPGGMHMYIEKNSTISLFSKDRFSSVYKYTPSVDLLFTSLSKSHRDQAMAIIMTGMGSDGAEGAKEAKDAGAYIMAQSEDSCTIYGMPRVVVEKNLHDDIIHLDNIAKRINSLCTGSVPPPIPKITL